MRRSPSRNASPHKRSGKPVPRGRQEGDTPGKGPDPAEFEPEFVIGNEELSRFNTPRPTAGQDGSSEERPSHEAPASEKGEELLDGTSQAHASKPSMELQTDVKVKLRKLERLESKYHGQ